jgi:hypothetical protein
VPAGLESHKLGRKDCPAEAGHDESSPVARDEVIAGAALSLLLIGIAVLRQEFIGDGVRHIHPAIAFDAPPIGAPRWLLFPAVSWVAVHPLASAGLVTSIEAGIRVLLLLSVLSGIVYLWSVDLWLRADGCSARSRAAAMVLAASTIPFLSLYSDITEVQIAAALVVAALAIARARTAAGRAGEGTVISLVAAIATAALVYQALILALAFIPLVVSLETIRRPRALLLSAAIVICVPAIMIASRIAAGDGSQVALVTTFLGERSLAVRSSMAKLEPLKWMAALVAGPPQAVVGLWHFEGLRMLAAGLSHQATLPASLGNLARLALGGIFITVLVWAIVRTRDWRLAVALMAVVALPVIRNQQYTSNKFFVFWPALLALASTKFRSRHVMAAALLVLALNGWIVGRDVLNGRARYSQMTELYREATPDTCFFTSDWSAPFPYLWPGSTSAIISSLWVGADSENIPHPLTASLQRCFCNSSRVWTDTTVENAQTIAGLIDHFHYREVPVGRVLFRPGDGLLIGPPGIFSYSPVRQSELCAQTLGP